MVQVCDTTRDASHSLALDAQRLEPRAELLHPEAIPLRFHGSWRSD